MKTYLRLFAFVLILLLTSLNTTYSIAQPQSGIYRTTSHTEALDYLTIEVLDDDLAHFEIRPTPPEDASLWTSLMVAKTHYGGASSIEFPSLMPNQFGNERPLLLAHYMPWYQTPDVSGYWGWHWTMDHFDPTRMDENGRPQIASQFTPLTGPYDSQDDAILEYQVLMMKLSGIDGVIVDWYGTANYNDYPELNASTGKLFEYITRAGLKFALCYEDRSILTRVNDGQLNTETALEQGQADLNYARDQWFGSDAYVTYQDQPLVFVFGPLYFRQPNDWTRIFADIEPTPALITLNQNLSFAALSGYPWPPMGMSGGVELELAPAALDSYLEMFYRNAQRRDFIVGSAFPGFHDIYAEAGVRSSYGYLDAQEGETLRSTLDMALTQNSDIVQLVTWNDYGEGTTIEPTAEYGYQYLEIIQQARTDMDSDFEISADDLHLPMRLLLLRRAHFGDAEINAALDRAFEAIIADDLAEARVILDRMEQA